MSSYSPLTPPDSHPSTPIKLNFDHPPLSSHHASTSAPKPQPYLHRVMALTDSLTSTVSSLTFGPVTSIARLAILAMMRHSIRYGRLRVLENEEVHDFPEGVGEDVSVSAEIRVKSPAFWLRLVTLGDLGFAEAYMAGDCEVSDLVEVFKVSACRAGAEHLRRRSRKAVSLMTDLHPLSSRSHRSNDFRRFHPPLPAHLHSHITHQLPIRQHHLKRHQQYPSTLRPQQHHVLCLSQQGYDVFMWHLPRARLRSERTQQEGCRGRRRRRR